MGVDVAGSPLSPFPRREWRGWLESMVRAAGRDDPNATPDIGLFLIRDGEIAALNAGHLGCPGPTNILSFPDGQGGGELFLSLDTLRRESMLYGQNTREHARRLLAHGLAHLAGYDHGPEMDAVCERMLL